ncbi:MAG: uracil-DNA glycosylase [Clostridia bacterium]|nr:uracil-DNA glycosylase [Clostridia bacterium]
MKAIGGGWDEILQDEFNSQTYADLRAFLKKEYSTQTVYPDMYDVYNAMRFVPFEKVSVVILGQDPYHGEGQAHGLSFSVQKGVTPPPSLCNIYKELKSDLGVENPADYGCLQYWAKQGVLLLNTVLTVRAGQANSHRGKGWEKLTDAIIGKLSAREQPVAFLLWGNPARAKKALIDCEKNLVLESAHPSPLSCRNFFGCKHFSKANDFLRANGFPPIDWDLNNDPNLHA